MYIEFILKLALVGIIMVLIARIGFHADNLYKRYRSGRKNRDWEDSYRILNDKLQNGEIEPEQYEELRKILDGNCRN